MGVHSRALIFQMHTADMSLSAAVHSDPNPDNADSTSPRLAPIDNPSSWKTKLTYAMVRWQQGIVITPLKVLWARMPEGLRLAYEMNALEDAVTLAPDLHLLVKELVATINGCSFCQDIVQDAYLRWRSVVPLDVTMPRLVRPSPAFSLHLPCSFPLFVRAQMLV